MSLLSDYFVGFFFTAKNVILAGVKSVCLHDPEDCKIEDLSSQVI